jgi:hypothetical protein
MKKISSFIILTAIMLSSLGLSAQDAETQENGSTPIEVYYFHYTHRCATCQAVEDVTEKSLKELYPEKVKNGEIVFLSVNIEVESNKPLVEQFKVGGQTLIFTRNDKIEKDLTNKAFLYAKEQPDKLKDAIGKTIDNL